MKWRRCVLKLAGGAFGVTLTVAAIWVATPWFVADPLVELGRHTPVRVWCDRNGKAVWYERTYDGEWRFPVTLAEIPQEVREFMLNVEDARFFEHGGVDYRAVARALIQNFGSGRVLSGASTISMQVAGLAYPKRGWRWGRKFLQAARARKMERLHTKEEILEAYFNHLPFGGKIVGIKSAAEYYFGLKVCDMTVAEASVLVGIPQAPNRFRPDRHPEAAARRQRLVLDSQVRMGKMTQGEADRLFREERVRYRDFTARTEWEEKGEAREWGFIARRLRVEGCGLRVAGCGLVRRSLLSAVTLAKADGEGGLRVEADADLCEEMKQILRRRTGNGVADAAAVVMDVATGEMRGYVGTLDFGAKKGGQVDAVRAVRSAGSTLKPFIYLEALEGGLITPESVLLDAPLRYSGYAPGNFDGTFHGEVTATEALSHSYNTPVVRLLATLGEARVTAAFERAGLCGTVKTNGLALALGSAGYRLADLAAAYRGLALKASVTNGASRAGVQLAAMLRTLPMPGAQDLPVAWKTGTSNNLKDAWCFAYTPDWVVGVWYGNKDGRASDRLVGVEIAAPAAGEIMSRLYWNRAPPEWPAFAGHDNLVGAHASRDCSGRAVGASLPCCAFRDVRRERVMILSPASQAYRLPSGQETLTLDLQCSEKDVYWFWNGTGVGAATNGVSLQVAFPVGRHRVVAVPADPARPEVAVSFTVSPFGN